MKKEVGIAFRKFRKAWKKIPWGKMIQFDPVPPAPKFKVNWPSGPAYEAKGRIGKFIEFMKANIEKEPIPPTPKFRINRPSGPAYEAMSSFGKFREFCKQNIEIQRYDSSSSINSSISGRQNFISSYPSSNSSNLSHMNPASGLPMINNNIDSRGNVFGSNSLSGINGISTSSTNGISNNGLY